MSQRASASSHLFRSPFYGPGSPGRYHGQRRCQLVLISNPLVNQASDFHKIAHYIHQYDPKIKATVITSRWRSLPQLLSRITRPTLGISFVSLARFRPPRGRFLYGKPLSKSEEYIAFEKAGFAIPKWQLIHPDAEPDLSDYGPYVVTKPNHGMQGVMVNIVRADRVLDRLSIVSDEAHPKSGIVSSPQDREMLAQQFIYTGEWPIKYRVCALFGKVLYSVKSEASRKRNKLSGPEAFEECEVNSVVYNGEGCIRTLNYDEEIIQLGEAAAAFPEIPLLGFDIVREVPSGKLYILEANAMGYVWHFSSSAGLQVQRDHNINLESQFDALRKAAHILADKTQELAQ